MLLVALFLTVLLTFATIILIKMMFEYINNKIQKERQERERELKAQKEKEYRDSIKKRDDEIIDLVMGYYKNKITFNFYSFERLLMNEHVEYNIHADSTTTSRFYIYLHELKIDMRIYKIKGYDMVQITDTDIYWR